jgi:hypothetical protein
MEMRSTAAGLGRNRANGARARSRISSTTRSSKSEYDVSKLAEKPEAGTASIQSFFTAKGGDAYAILPRCRVQRLRPKGLGNAANVSLLGAPDAQVRWHADGDALAVDLPAIPEGLLSSGPGL